MVLLQLIALLLPVVSCLEANRKRKEMESRMNINRHLNS